MRAAVFHEYGGAEVLRVETVPDPKLGQNGVLIDVRAAGLNPADLALQQGLGDSIMDAFFPVIPGWDVAGVVAAVGDGVSELAPGDEVIGYVRQDVLHHGTYAEQVVADVSLLAPRPRPLSWEQAAGLPLAGLTAYQAVVHQLAVGSRDTLLVHGAAGGVGSLAAQIARDRGARVVGTASATNHDYLRSLGVEPVLYGDGLADRVRRLAPAGVTAILDAAGRGGLGITGQVAAANVRVRATAGAPDDVRAVYARANRDDLMALVELAEHRRITVRVAAAFPLHEAAAAQRHLATGHAHGKVVLAMDRAGA